MVGVGTHHVATRYFVSKICDASDVYLSHTIRTDPLRHSRDLKSDSLKAPGVLHTHSNAKLHAWPMNCYHRRLHGVAKV